jgi:preprotein translocase subunit SecG
MIEQAILILHVLAAIAIVALVLLQQGKGADAGASFGGGSSQTVFGVQGSGNALTQWTSILAAGFFCNKSGVSLLCKAAESCGYRYDN